MIIPIIATSVILLTILAIAITVMSIIIGGGETEPPTRSRL